MPASSKIRARTSSRSSLSNSFTFTLPSGIHAAPRARSRTAGAILAQSCVIAHWYSPMTSELKWSYGTATTSSALRSSYGTPSSRCFQISRQRAAHSRSCAMARSKRSLVTRISDSDSALRCGKLTTVGCAVTSRVLPGPLVVTPAGRFS